jgi:hypothetical protein
MTAMLAPTKNRITQVMVGVASLKNGVVCMEFPHGQYQTFDL